VRNALALVSGIFAVMLVAAPVAEAFRIEPAPATDASGATLPRNGTIEEMLPAGESPHGLAIVIGVANYDHVPTLVTPVNDANQIADVLLGRGLHIIKVLDPVRADFVRALDRAEELSEKYDRILFYYSGHGMSIREKSFIIFRDAPSDIQRIGSSLYETNAAIDFLQATFRTRLMVFDACSNNPFDRERVRSDDDLGTNSPPEERVISEARAARTSDRNVSRLGTQRSSQAQKSTVTRGIGTAVSPAADSLIVLSSLPGTLAQDVSTRRPEHSPLAAAVLDEFDAGERNVTTFYRQVRRRVLQDTNSRQVPFIQDTLVSDIEPDLRTGGESGQEGTDTGPGGSMMTLDGSLRSALPTLPRQLPRAAALKALNLDPDVTDGLNFIQLAQLRTRIWIENNIVSTFDEPYRNSAAILIGVTSYEGAGRNTGFRDLPGSNALLDALRDELVRLGFPPRNIVTLREEQATRKAIVETLARFHGGGGKPVDRLFVYFAGHGDHVEGFPTGGGQDPIGYVVPYDFDRDQAILSGIPMDELRRNVFRYITARQVLLMIDACSSGLAIPRSMGAPDLEKAVRWRALRERTAAPYRAIFVASTGAAEAYAKTEGIFSQALLLGLRGAADLNRDHVIVPLELQQFIDERVRNRANALGVSQTPEFYDEGEGRMVFLPTADSDAPAGRR
jgi:uncharacterized caspase-like protein